MKTAMRRTGLLVALLLAGAFGQACSSSRDGDASITSRADSGPGAERLRAETESVLRRFYTVDSVALVDTTRQRPRTEAEMKAHWMEVLGKAKVQVNVQVSGEGCRVIHAGGRYRLELDVSGDGYYEEGSFFFTWREAGGRWTGLETLVSPGGYRRILPPIEGSVD